MDIGCAVGRSAFELSREFKEVVGVDFSTNFISVCNELKDKGSLSYTMTTEGLLYDQLVAAVDQDIVNIISTFV